MSVLKKWWMFWIVLGLSAISLAEVAVGDLDTCRQVALVNIVATVVWCLAAHIAEQVRE